MKTKLLLMLVTIALAAGVAQANMLINPGFEDGAFGWERYYTDYPAQHVWVTDAPDAHGGSTYLKMYNWIPYGSSSTDYVGQEIPVVKEGDDYSFSVWAKNTAEDQLNQAAVNVEWLDSLSETISSTTIYIPIADANWVEIDFGSLVSPQGAVSATFWLTAPLYNGTNAICYDDVSMIGPDPNINAGADMISWDGQTISLTGTTTLDGYSTITWSAEPDYCADITDGDTLTPTVDVNPIIPSGPATIENHSFESGLDNWVTVSGSGHGTWNGAAVTWNGTGVSTKYIIPTDGVMCAYLDGLSDGQGALSQVLVNTLAANTTYTLSVDVVNDGYYEEDVAYRVQLRAGGSILAQDNDGHALDTYGAWETSTVTYDSGATPAELGEQLEIRLIAKNGTEEMNFDNVRLTADPPFPAYVPNILTLTLTLDIDGKYDTMKIDAYPDACAGWLGAGLREATDLVGDGCITNLADLAETVKTWTDHNALTAPKVKEQQEPVGPGAIAIDNAGFELPAFEDDGDWNVGTVEAWGYIGDSDSFGAWDPGVNDEIYYGYKGTAPEGENVGYVQVGTDPEYPGGLAQVLAETFKANMEYTLTVQVGNTYYYTDSGDYVIELLAGGDPADNAGQITAGTVLASFTENAQANIEPDTFELRTVEYTFDAAHVDLVGEHLQIRLYLLNGEEVDFDDVRLVSKSGMVPSPANGAYIAPESELKLGWTNMDPNKPGDPVYVDVWFGTDPNNQPPPSPPDYDFNKIVDGVEDANSVTINASTLGTYYWQVNSYIYGSATGDPIEGIMWKFDVVSDAPVSVEVGDDVITWSGQEVQLAASVDDDGASALTIAGWSADPATGVVFDPNEFVEDPTVTITKVTDNPSVVTLTFEVSDAVGSNEDTMKIDVYDTACLAAIGEGEEYDSGDFDADCDTDLEDYAAIAEEWLVYKELTTSIVKP